MRNKIYFLVIMLLITSIILPVSGKIPNINNEKNNEINTIRLNPENPEAPTINGPAEGDLFTDYEYEIISEDPQCDDLCFKIRCTDMPVIYNSEMCESGECYIFIHAWDNYYQKSGSYTIYAQAIDCKGYKSDWSTLEVSMPKNKLNSPIYSIFQKIFEQINFLKLQKLT